MASSELRMWVSYLPSLQEKRVTGEEKCLPDAGGSGGWTLPEESGYTVTQTLSKEEFYF